MPAPTEEVWNIEDHTRVKHDILRRYLRAWIPIVTSHQSHAVLIDGFAGPGEYRGGEPGSPVIAIDAWQQRRNQAKGKDVEFVFIEEDARRVRLSTSVVQ